MVGRRLFLVGRLYLLLLLQRDFLHSGLGHPDDFGVLVETIEFLQPGDTFGTSQYVATFNGPGLHLEATIHGHGGESDTGDGFIEQKLQIWSLAELRSAGNLTGGGENRASEGVFPVLGFGD